MLSTGKLILKNVNTKKEFPYKVRSIGNSLVLVGDDGYVFEYLLVTRSSKKRLLNKRDKLQEDLEELDSIIEKIDEES